jgi:plastocyanin
VTSGTSGAGSAIWSRRSLLVACSLAPFIRRARADEATVEIYQFMFAPTEIAIAAGGSVAFVNLDLVPHTATGDGFDTGTLRKGDRAAIRFPNAGTFPYLCKFHRHMTGRVLVT